MRDVCHGYNLACKEGLKEIPERFLSFVKRLCAHFGRSAIRKARLREIQASHGCKEPLNMVKFIDIRWLSLQNCCDRIIKLWPYLEEYFKDEDSALKEDFTKEYYLFTKLLSCLLNKLNHYNVYFQKDSLVLNQVLEKIREGYTLFAQMLLDESSQDLDFDQIYTKLDKNTLKNIESTDGTNLENFRRNFLSRYSEFTNLIDEAKNDLLPNFDSLFFSSARNFIRNVLIIMREKLPFENKILLQSESIYFEQKRFDLEVWRQLGKSFPNIIKQDRLIEYEEEIHRLKFNYLRIKEKHESQKTSILKTWNRLSQDYPNVAMLARALLVFPYSTASVESIFSKFKVYKTPYRSRLSVESLEASLLIEQSFENEEPQILPEMLEKYVKLWELPNQEENIDSNDSMAPIIEQKAEVIPSQAATIATRISTSEFEILIEDNEFGSVISPEMPTVWGQKRTSQSTLGEKRVKRS